MSFLDTSSIEEEQLDAVKSTVTKKKTTTKKKSTSTTKKTASSTKKTTSRKRTTKNKYSKTGIPGLSVKFSWKEFLGITKLKRAFTKKTGIPTTQAGIERKIGNKLINWMKEKVGWKES
ncbi:MAG: hypothetical protein IJ604_06730 [Prevotella sp.]|nr:hypothetical protein [Prevotella sp.]